MNLHKMSVVLLALLLAAMAMVPMVSAVNDSAKQLTEPQLITISDSTQKETLTEMIKELGATSNGDVKERNILIKQLQEIVKGRTSLSNTQKADVLSRAGKILAQSDTMSGTITPQWAGCYYPGCSAEHNDMAKVAGQKMGVNSYYTNILYQYASEPDRSGSADHYAITGAPQKAEDWANAARPLIRSGTDPSTGYKDLSYSMHYMSDMSEPFHYAVVYLANHAAYESYVDANWNSSKTYVNAINGNTYYYYITDVSASADNLAAFALQYRQYINNEMNTVSNWGDDPTLVQDTKDCLVYGERYDMGLVNYATRP